MADPLDALRIPAASTDPDPAFAAALRARLERLLLAPEETMTTTTHDAPSTETAAATITSYLAVVDARASVEFYVGALGAARRGEPIVMPDGRVGHVEVQVGSSRLMLADEFPEMGLAAPVTRGGPSQSLHLETADPDAIVDAAVARGARLERPVADGPYGRTGVVTDPDGHRWMISRSPATARPGEVVYASLWAPDQERTLRFYAQVLGWTTRGGHAPDVGLGTFAAEPTTLYCCYHVPDVDAAVALVRRAGGTAEEPTEEAYGRTAMCVDDQGLPFAVSASDRPLPGGPGSLGYREMRVPDAVAARAFYGTVLGWRFLPGNTEGFWHPAGHEDAVVLSGGHDAATVVPWFRVDDVEAATAAAREAGGTATPDERGATCTDDQGAPFALISG